MTAAGIDPARPRPPERADAARNRARVLAAAAELFRTRDPRSVTMDDVARAAGVGRATLYRRYPDVGSIAVALLDSHERVLQEQLLRGAPPLGPGAPPGERLAAFYRAMVDLLEEHLPLVLGADAGAARFSAGAYGAWRAHVRALIVAAGTVDDPDPLVDVLLAPLAAEVYRYQRRERRISPERIAGTLARLAHEALGQGGLAPRSGLEDEAGRTDAISPGHRSDDPILAQGQGPQQIPARSNRPKRRG